MDVSHLPILRFVHQRRTSDVIPHLTTGHGKDKEQCDHTPSVFVVQKLQIIAPHVHQNTGDSNEDEHGNCSGVVWWPEHSNVDLGPLIDPFGDGLGTKADSLNIHSVHLLWLAFGREMHENRGRIELHDLKSHGSLTMQIIFKSISNLVPETRQGLRQSPPWQRRACWSNGANIGRN